ncbi:hypothetical protein J4573_16510 [Actinomadura barringtoniae]|uniref:Nuclear transport factor 2 family protein n=1 Tax=Actinomadura barringtoniae TaxID=1427535 RepID=A0A939P9W1_9ACTN|nr:hypothetical protein [Actinomadura barringtoniae]MBO2448706.1 hypothetical protein [Actinomadura barringtoniae]
MRVLLAVLAGLLITSCGSNEAPVAKPGLDGARDIATAWYEAVVDGDADGACRLMSASMRTKVTTDNQASDCENGIRQYFATVDETAKRQMQAKDFTVTPDGANHAYVRINRSWRAPTFEESWAQGRWGISGIIT